MRTFMITAAALLAGTGFAMAQSPSQPDDNGNNSKLNNSETHDPNNGPNNRGARRNEGVRTQGQGRLQSEEPRTQGSREPGSMSADPEHRTTNGSGGN